MASLTTSPIHASIYGGGGGATNGHWSGQKRRPIDPEETGSASVATTLAPYDSEVTHLRPHAKRPRTIDDVLGSLSLRPPDPPGNFGNKRKSSDDDESGSMSGQSAKVPRCVGSGSVTSAFDENPSNNINSCADDKISASQGRQMDPSGRKGHSPTNVTSEILLDSSMQQQQQPHQQNISLTQTASTNYSLDINDMAIDDSDHESDSSVSEGSIRNAMYQLVFGRKNNPPPSLVGSGVGSGLGRCYDSVDSKIEDLIRRSRLEAAIKSQKKETNKEEMAATSDMDMDDVEGGDADEDDEWNPGHG